MNKIILACFQDDRFSLIFEPLVSELLMIKLVLAWICACQWMHICLLFTGDISPKRKIKIQNSCVSWRFSIARFLCLVFSRSQICRLLIKTLSLIIGPQRNLTRNSWGLQPFFNIFPWIIATLTLKINSQKKRCFSYTYDPATVGTIACSQALTPP